MLFLCAGIIWATDPDLAPEKIDWPAFMRQHDMRFDRLPRNWKEAPHFGNASVGSMLYQAGNTIRLQIFCADVQDHRDDAYGWPAYSRPRLQIGHFSLNPLGKLTGCHWRKDLWNAELTGTIQTDRGEIRIRHFTHADDMAIVTELTPSAGEQGCHWTWHPVEAITSRPGYPIKESEIAAFAKKYGKHYATTLKVFKPNPAGRQQEKGPVSVWVQDFLAGGQYATASCEQIQKDTRTHIVSIANSYPESTAADAAVSDVTRFLKRDGTTWVKSHRSWWQAYLPHEVAGDMIGNRAQDMRYYAEVGNLPWTINNFWSQYRFSMDDEMLREKIYPLLRRSVNLYLHMVEEGQDGKLHLPPTYSPETGAHQDCNFDLALFKWGCYSLLKASKRLEIDDPLIPQWKKVVNNLVDFPADENGFRLGSDHASSPSHRHFLIYYRTGHADPKLDRSGSGRARSHSRVPGRPCSLERRGISGSAYRRCLSRFGKAYRWEDSMGADQEFGR
jgi:hypothetical protein